MISTNQKNPSIVASEEKSPCFNTVENTVKDIDDTTIQHFENEITRMKLHLVQKEQPDSCPHVYTVSTEVKNIVRKYGKRVKSKTKQNKPYEKQEYTKGMSNFIAFISQIMPMCSPQRKIHRRFLVLLWDIYKSALSTWFDEKNVSKENALSLGKDKYITYLKKNVVSVFPSQFPQIIQKLELYDETQNTDSLRVKVMNQHQEDISQPALLTTF